MASAFGRSVISGVLFSRHFLPLWFWLQDYFTFLYNLRDIPM
ncbi:hypothetical protein SSYM_0822 [Serratia symbiotica str. Tucson]|uniref:Uncharacterized protein n=1 Tax=Serratia symbiotica str. Tucson TaxID=914128 RepID=E9CKW9_9GAMM|nr:hypothetical protein SSYM_0822 [Serratia symbiotica str. Tucson]